MSNAFTLWTFAQCDTDWKLVCKLPETFDGFPVTAVMERALWRRLYMSHVGSRTEMLAESDVEMPRCDVFWRVGHTRRYAMGRRAS